MFNHDELRISFAEHAIAQRNVLLRKAAAELRMHNAEYNHRSPESLIKEIESTCGIVKPFIHAGKSEALRLACHLEDDPA